MSLIQKVNELIDLLETTCEKHCLTENKNGVTIEFNDEISFTYHNQIGVFLFYNDVWYTDEERIDRVKGIPIPNMREKMIELCANSKISIQSFEKTIFKLS